jgi:hypothetical protein
MAGIHRLRAGLTKHPNSVEVQHRKNLLRGYLLSAQEVDCIDARNRTREVKCSCMKDLRLSEADAVSAVEFLFGFALLTKMEQQTMVKEWIKYSVSVSKGYRRNEPEFKKAFLLPGTVHLICKNALCYLLGLGSGAWLTIVKLAKLNLPPSHGLCGLKSNNANEERDLIMKDYLDKVQKLAAPRATLVVRSIVRDEVQTELRDDDEELLELPSNMSKRSIYNKLVGQLGWTFTYDARSKIINRERIEFAGAEEEQEEMEAPPAWITFRNYWKKNYPKLVIAGARQDVCNECYVFANKHRFAKRKTKEGTTTDEDADQGPHDDNNSNEEADEAAMLESERLVALAAVHVEMAQQQRELYRQKKREAIATAGNAPGVG